MIDELPVLRKKVWYTPRKEEPFVGIAHYKISTIDPDRPTYLTKYRLVEIEISLQVLTIHLEKGTMRGRIIGDAPISFVTVDGGIKELHYNSLKEWPLITTPTEDLPMTPEDLDVIRDTLCRGRRQR